MATHISKGRGLSEEGYTRIDRDMWEKFFTEPFPDDDTRPEEKPLPEEDAKSEDHPAEYREIIKLLPKDFLLFLERNEALEAYCENRFKDKRDAAIKNKFSFVRSAFSWNSAPEGLRFWRKIDVLWIEECKE